MFVSWIRHHGRSAALAESLGLPPVWLPRQGSLLRSYVSSTRRTVQEVRRRRPAVVGVMLPPLPALLAVLLARPLGTRILADLHTGVFLDPRWRWCRGVTLRLLRGHCAVVTNEALAQVCRAAGVQTFVLHDILDVDHGRAPAAAATSTVEPHVMVPLSYANDEPVDEILEAAELIPEVRFLLTGSAPAPLVARAPANVRFTGYLDLAEYEALLAGSDVVLALTTRDLTMQRAGYEGLQAGVPVVTSDFDTLRQYFGPAAVFTGPQGRAIATAVRTALRDNAALRATGRDRLRELLGEQSAALRSLSDWVAGRERVTVP